MLRANQAVLSISDAFWHWDMGQRLIREGWVRTDPYSYLAADRTWVLNQWGTEAVLGVVDAVGGLWAVGVTATLLTGTAFLVTGLAMWRRRPCLVTVVLLGLVVVSASGNLGLRGNLFTFLLFPLLLLELDRDDRSRPMVILGLVAVWANLHAGFLLGLAITVVHTVGRLLGSSLRGERVEAPHAFAVVGAAVIAGCLTPYGPAYLLRSLALTGRAGETPIGEWASTPLTGAGFLPFTLLAVVGLTALLAVGTTRDMARGLTVIALFVLGASAIRNVAPAAIGIGLLAVPYVADLLARFAGADRRGSASGLRAVDQYLVIGTAVAVGVLALWLVPRTSDIAGHVSSAPLATIEHLRDVPRGARVHASFWSAPVSVLGGDRVQTTVDGRLELFTNAQVRRGDALDLAQHGWQQTLSDWCVSDIVIPTDLPLMDALLATDTGFELVRTDAVTGRTGVQAAWWVHEDPAVDCVPRLDVSPE